jgi:hypothetical protein
MPKRRTITLTESEQEVLEGIRDHHQKAYVRERAAAILKIAAGMSPHAVACKGLLKARDPDAIYGWMDRYEREGLKGLLIRKGRGRKPSFSPYA